MKRLVAVALTVLGLSVAVQSVAVEAQAAKSKSHTTSGVVKSVSATALTIAKDGKDMTFTVDGMTKFVGKGLGTKARMGKLTAPDAVGMDDAVSVTYHDMGGTMHAASVRITNKAMVKK